MGDLVLLSMKDLKYQMTGRRMEKLTERFVGPYKIKSIVLTNAIELELPSTVKIHPVVNISRVCRYTGQVEGQKKEKPQLVIIEGEEEWEVEKCYKMASELDDLRRWIILFHFHFLLLCNSLKCAGHYDSKGVHGII